MWAFHLVSSTVPGDEHVEVSRELSDNIFATLRFLEVCERQEVPRVVFASTVSGLWTANASAHPGNGGDGSNQLARHTEARHREISTSSPFSPTIRNLNE